MSPNIYKVKEDPPDEPRDPGFFCTTCTIWHTAGCKEAGFQLCLMEEPFNPKTSWGSCRPNRCSNCDRDLKRWQRIQKWKRKIMSNFDYDKHRFLKFGTVGLPGDKIFPIENEDDYIEFRERLTHNFKELRREPLWKECVDGGMWFFEVTERPIPVKADNQVRIIEAMVVAEKAHYAPLIVQPTLKKINPHLHILFFGPKKVPYKPLQELCAKHGLGRFKFSKPTDKAGNDILPGIKNALYYTMSYLKKETQVSGRNRDTFGVLR